MTFTACYTLACLLTELLLCRPLTAYWTVPKPSQQLGRTCADLGIYYMVNGILGTFATIYTIVLPLLVIRNIPMSKTQWVALKAFFVITMRFVSSKKESLGH
jgi:hypothetical protein